MSDVPRSSILVVEDDDTVREVVSELLRDEGYAVFEADDGLKAIAALRQHRPPPETLCLVILDMALPGSDGIQVLNALASFGGYVPVVAVSADREQLVRATQAGVDAALAKPYDLDRLLAIIERNCCH